MPVIRRASVHRTAVACAESTAQMTRRIPDAQWESHKATIKSFYLSQDRTLEETREYMRTRHGFDAT